MPRTEEGEFELVLGNKQLLSVFFIVVILLGVFFTMGYIVGRSSAPAVTDVAAARRTETRSPDAPARASESAPSESPSPAAAPPAPAAETSSAPPASALPPVETKPETKPEKPAAKKVEAPPEPQREAPISGEPAAGKSYLQLAATSKREADIMVDVLRQKGFQALAAEIPEKRGTFRVLVGPITDSNGNKMRADLQGAGFPGSAAIRRTF